MTAMGTLWLLLMAIVVQGAPQETTEEPEDFGTMELFEGDTCTLPYNNPGVCSNLKDCEIIVSEIRKGKKPTICSFDKEVSIVCCPVGDYKPQPLASTSSPVKRPGDKAREACEVYHQTMKNLSLAKECQRPIPPTVTIDIRYADYIQARHMAAIGYGEGDIAWTCSGSLISPKFVLVAAHCLQSKKKVPARWVRLGDQNLKDSFENDYAQQFSVSERIPHPDYRPPSNYNDVGLLRLDKEILLTDHVYPACLHMGEVNDTLYALGWGLRSWLAIAVSDSLMTLALFEKPMEQCENILQATTGTKRLRHDFDNTTMLCVGDFEGYKDTCQDESEGHVGLEKLREEYCTFSIVGVASFGISTCGAKNSPAVYSRVSHYVPWIESVVWP